MPTERTPLVSPTSRGKRRSSSDGGSPSPSRQRHALEAGLGGAGIQLGEDDLCIEAMVLVLLRELVERGYAVPQGLVEAPPEMSREEADAETQLYRTVFSVRRHRDVFAECLPILPAQPSLASTAQLDLGLAPATAGGLPTPLASDRSPSSSRPSPSSSQLLDPAVLSAPSALLLAALLSLLISLQTELVVVVQETDRGVDGELRMFKARRDLGERLYAVVEGLLDSYLLSGDERNDDGGEDALVRLLFHDFPLNYDSVDRATCALDLLLNLSSQELVEAESLVSHPVVLASTEYVWRNGLLPPPPEGVDATLSWKESILGLDRFSVPRILHSQAYILSTLHAAITIYILMFSSYAHFDALNPLAPDAGFKIPERGRPEKSWSLITSLVWWLWVAGTIGWAGEVGRAWHHRGPHPSLPLSPSTLLPLIHHLLVAASITLRFSLLLMRRPPALILASSLTMLAWSVPFLAASRVLPQNLPAFGAPTHQRWEKIRDGRKRRDVGYRPPPKVVPQSHRALRSLEAHLGGLVQFGTYFGVFGVLLLWSLSGELDYPGYFFLPLSFLRHATTSDMGVFTAGTVSPIEARTTLAFTLVLGVVLAYFAGGRPSISGKVVAPVAPGEKKPQRGLDDLDGWARYGREVAFRARRERLAVNRYFSFVPADPHPSADGVPSAFSTPPLTSPLNLCIPPLLFASAVSRWLGRDDLARTFNERGRLWVWRMGISPLGLWAALAKTIRSLRGKE